MSSASQIQISDDDVELIQQVQTDSQILWLQQTPYIVHAMEEQTECMPEHATDLSGPEFGVLSRLAAFGKGEMRQNEIATVMGWEKGRLSHQLTRMEKRKLIKRRPADGRGTLVAFTKIGREKLEYALPARAESVRRNLLSRLSAEQIDMIVRVNNILGDEE